jgi:hypothetical protein
MKSRTCLFIAAIITLSLSMINRSEAQVKQLTAAKVLETLKPGQWVQLEGVIQKNSSVECSEVQILTGDFLDDDWSLSAVIHSLDKMSRQAKIMNLLINFQKDAEYENDAGTFRSFADLKVGMLVELEGTYLKDGTFLAKEVEDESAKLAEKPRLKDEIQVEGKVEKVDVDKRVITLMGIPFQLTDKTRYKSAIK